jgi:RimJ/RimL family protein N-acetyltransferase
MGYFPAKEFLLPTGQRLVVRNPVPEDAAHLLDYAHVVLQESEYFLLEPDELQLSEEEEQDWIQEHCEEHGSLLLAAEVDGFIVGLIGFENGPQRRVTHRGNLHVSVARPWRGIGIGTILLQSLIDWAIADPIIEKVSLSVMVSNHRAIGLYRKFGFREEGCLAREIKIAPGRYEDELLMCRFVKPTPPFPVAGEGTGPS